MTTDPTQAPQYYDPSQPVASYPPVQAPYQVAFQQPMQPYPYGQGAYAPYAVAARPSNGMGIAALVLGIIAWLLLPLIGAVLAIVFGVAGRQAAVRDGSESGTATAGLVLGAIQIGLCVLGLVIALIGIVTVRQ